MPTAKDDKMPQYLQYAIIILVILLFVLAGFLAKSYRSIEQAHIISSREFFLSTFVRNHGSLTASDTELIRPWMTFDYINKLFKLPSGYLQATFVISSSGYPKISLSAYAKSDHLNATSFLTQVQAAVHNYLITSTSTNAVAATSTAH